VGSQKYFLSPDAGYPNCTTDDNITKYIPILINCFNIYLTIKFLFTLRYTFELPLIKRRKISLHLCYDCMIKTWNKK